MFTEPITSLTDFIMAFVSIVIAILLYKISAREKQRSVEFWGHAFLAMGVASVFAGISHGLRLILGPSFFQIVWNMTMLFVGVSSFFMLSGTILASFKRPLASFLMVIVLLKFLIYGTWIWTHNLTFDDYHIAIYDYGSALLFILILQIYFAITKKNKSAYWFIFGVVLSSIAGLVQQEEVVLHKYFNHNDLYHLISLISFYVYYRGSRLLKDRV